MLNPEAFPDSAAANTLFFPADVLKDVLVRAKKSDAIKVVGEAQSSMIGPVLDKEIEPIRRFFHDDGGELLDREDYVLVHLSACVQIFYDKDNPGRVKTMEDLIEEEPFAAFWYDRMTKFDRDFSDACLDNESMHPYLPPGRAAVSDYIRSPNINPTEVDGSAEVGGYWCQLPRNMKELLDSCAKYELSYESLELFWRGMAASSFHLSNRDFVTATYKMLRQSIFASLVLAANFLLEDKANEAVHLILYSAIIDECCARGPDYMKRFWGAYPDSSAEFLSANFYSFHCVLESTNTWETMCKRLKESVHFIPQDAAKLLGSTLEKIEAKDIKGGSIHSLRTKPFHETNFVNINIGNGLDFSSRRYYKNTSISWLVKYHAVESSCISGLENTCKSFRVSHKENTIFLSSSGKKTLAELGIDDGDDILINGLEDQSSSVPAHKESSRKDRHKKNNKKKSTTKSAKKKRAKKTQPSAPVLSEEEIMKKNRQLHSRALSNVFDELRPCLKVIRNKLNELNIKKSAPKSPTKVQKRGSTSHHDGDISGMFNEKIGVGGKAGKVLYPILVGEPANLYKPMKRVNVLEIIDLHGCTKEDALSKLDNILPVWMDTAMKGQSPFAIAVNILCGGGNQILSEAVAKWIRDTHCVANRPKGTMM
ncbi:hypothetical protein ACHAWF_013790 [Thalassiosira exigua]